MPKIYTRKEWGARYRHGFGTRKLPVSLGFKHHSVTNAPGPNATLAQDKAHMRVIESIGNARFGSISYPYVIMPSGRIFRGLTDNRIGAHTAGYNTTSIGICYAGNYQSTEPNAKQLEAGAALIAHLVSRGSLSETFTIWGHRAVSATACPGSKLYARIGSIVTRAKRLIAAGATAVDPTYTLGRRLYLRPRIRIRGSNVRRLQQELTANGFGGMSVNGTFGPTTDKQVRRFQKSRRLDVDGVVGRQTATALGWKYTGK